MKYTIAPITALSDKPEVAELCKMLARGEIDQASAQAAAWHMEDGLTWEQLLAKEKVHLSNGHVEMYFNRGNIAVAMKAKQAARLSALRMMKTALVNRQTEDREKFTDAEATKYRAEFARLEKTSPYREAALTALRSLTGQDAEPTAAAWRRVLNLPGPGQP